MNARQIDAFFKTLAREFDEKAVVVLTGAAAGAILGRARPSLDIDFAVELARSGDWDKLARAVERTVKLAGISANYAEDIDRWGMVTLLDYRKHARPYKKFGGIEVRILEPEYWSIGKMTRYLDPDVRDLIQVFKTQKVPAARLARLWGRALRESPSSTGLHQFRRQVEHFLATYGREIWGKEFDPEPAVRAFHREAGINEP